jgi:hypothetical protein
MVNVSLSANAQVVAFSLAQILNLDLLSPQIILEKFSFQGIEEGLVKLLDEDP